MKDIKDRHKFKYSTEIHKDCSQQFARGLDGQGTLADSLFLDSVDAYRTKGAITSKSRIDSIKFDIREKTRELKKRRDTCSNERAMSMYN